MLKSVNLKNVKNVIPSYFIKRKDLKNMQEEVDSYFNSVQTTINILMLIDNNTSNEASAKVRNLFLSDATNVKLQINYFDSDSVAIDENADMIVIVTCDSEVSGEVAKNCRDAGVPAYTVFDESVAVFKGVNPSSLLLTGDYCVMNQADENSVKKMEHKLGCWIANVCVGKKFAFARAFKFVAKPLVTEIVHLTAIENASVGLVPVISAADFPLMFLNQLKMLAQIATVYGRKIDYAILKEAAGVLVGAIFGRKVSRVVKKIIPLPKFIVSPCVAFATTEVIGRALIAYFEAGGEIDGVVALLKKTLEGSKSASVAIKPITSRIVSSIKK